MLVSPDVARTAGINVPLMNLLYLQAFALTIALGLRFLGVLLMGALIIIPPATARRLARTLAQMLWASVIIAVAATAIGHALAGPLGRDTGPVIVVVAAAGFVISLLRR
jgi:ABC-type Mn2+/Zn2+ transport system permease subunit